MDDDDASLASVSLAFDVALASNVYRHPPAVLYHYTTFAGLTGIIDSGAIWATDHRFLNDGREFSYGFELALHVIGELARTERELSWYFEAFRESVERIGESPYQYYLACFCEERDLARQWDYYADHGGGFCLAFDAHHLGPLARPFHFTKVTYDVEAQRELLVKPLTAARDAFIDCIRLGKAISMEGGFAEYVFGRTYQHLIHWIATVKSADWTEEREWRAMFQADEDASRLFRYRGRSIPFLTFDLRDERKYGGALPLLEVLVGRKFDSAAEQSVRTLLDKRGYAHVPVVAPR